MAPSSTAPPAGSGQRTPSTNRQKEPQGVFVYGTLMTGFAAHDRLATGLVRALPGTLSGHQMVHLPQGYPALFESPESALLVYGELLMFESLEAVLPGFDAYERCDPEDPGSLYRRVSVEVRSGADTARAWCYTFAAHGLEAALEGGGVLVPEGDWRGFSRGLR